MNNLRSRFIDQRANPENLIIMSICFFIYGQSSLILFSVYTSTIFSMRGFSKILEMSMSPYVTSLSWVLQATSKTSHYHLLFLQGHFFV